MTWTTLPLPARPDGDLQVVADLVLELPRLRQNECKWLSIENFAPELLGKLLREIYPPPPVIYKEDA